MSEWLETELGELITLQRGYDLTEKEATPGPFPVISSGGPSYTTDVAKVTGPGVVTGRKGVLGKVHFSPGPYWPHDTTLWVKDFKGADPRFVYYLLQTLPLASLDAGASNPTLNRNHAHLLRVRVPPPSAQRHIGSVLASMDELVENNRRRVEALEDMARAIYREWFVHFRYPGHEDVALVDSPLGPIPDGWSAIQVGDVAEARRGLSWTRDSESVDGTGTSVVTIPNLGARLNLGGCTQLSDISASDRERFSLRGGDILLIGSNGNPDRVGHAVRVPPDIDAVFASFLMRVRPDVGATDPLLLFHQLSDRSGIMAAIRATAVGATGLRNLRISTLREALVLLPSRGLSARFGELAGSLTAASDALDRQSTNLATLRDHILPRLVSGQTDLSQLDRDALTEAAIA